MFKKWEKTAVKWNCEKYTKTHIEFLEMKTSLSEVKKYIITHLLRLITPSVDEGVEDLKLSKTTVTPQLCPTLCDPMDCSPPGSSLHGILQAKILEWVALPSSRGSSQPRDWTQISYIGFFKGGFFTIWATKEAL